MSIAAEIGMIPPTASSPYRRARAMAKNWSR